MGDADPETGVPYPLDFHEEPMYITQENATSYAKLRQRIAGLDFSKYKKKDQRRSATPDIMAQQFGDPENIKKSFPGKKIREFYNEALTGDLSRDYQVREIDVKAYLNSKEKTCPGCQRNYRDFPSLSRDDNKTELCPGCGLAEAVRDEGTTKAMQPKRTGTGRWDFE